MAVPQTLQGFVSSGPCQGMMSPKRPRSSSSSYEPSSKRTRRDSDVSTSILEARTGTESDHEPDLQEDLALESALKTLHSSARCGIQKSLALVLKYDGFDSATPEALESFTEICETYLVAIIQETKRLAAASRREHPTPVDFEAMLRHFNLPISTLKPHVKHPISPQVLSPEQTYLACPNGEATAFLPLLGSELSGKTDKDEKPYIPSTFPEFPSRHTYSFTPQDDTNLRDPKRTREEAAKSGQQGEDALRRLVRASKMRKQKEAKSLVERNVQGKERFRLWEATMKRFMGVDSKGENTNQIEIADHSMIVNGDAQFTRKEFSRSGKWSASGRNI